MKKIITLSLCGIFFLALAASAHQPRIISGTQIIQINQPEISQAFYASLSGQPAVYEINSPTPFALYVGLLLPLLPDVDKNVTATITRKNQAGEEIIADLNGTDFAWSNFFEPFAGDNYWQGPEYRSQAAAGQYFIQVKNTSNSGKYVLAVGETESFPSSTFISTITDIVHLKTDFFNKPVWSVFEGKIIRYLTAGLIFLLMILGLIFALIIKKRKQKKLSTVSQKSI